MLIIVRKVVEIDKEIISLGTILNEMRKKLNSEAQ